MSRDGAVDDSVNVIAFRGIEGTLKAIIVNATCHPVYEMCIPQVSPDYPGELTSMLDEQHPGVVTAFLNGAAGNINPQTVSSGPSESRRHAESLAAIVNTILKNSTVEPTPYLALSRSACLLATRLPKGEDIGITLTATISALHIGATAIVFIPGEPFAETALAIRRASVFELTAIVGFSEESIGYIPTDQAFAEGGYEAGFGKWSMLSPGSEVRIQRDSLSLLENLVTGEYERLAPTVPMPLGGANVTIESSPDGRRTSTVRRGGR